MDIKSVYQFTVRMLNGREISLSRFKNKVLLIVNTASECGFTPQLKELEELRLSFEEKDFAILAFPSNDFGNQEPLEGNLINEFCHKNFDTHFQIFDKIRVRGAFAHPLYKFLSDKKQNGAINSTPKWNFHKYLIDRKGQVADFFYPFTKPGSSRIKKKVNKLLALV